MTDPEMCLTSPSVSVEVDVWTGWLRCGCNNSAAFGKWSDEPAVKIMLLCREQSVSNEKRRRKVLAANLNELIEKRHARMQLS